MRDGEGSRIDTMRVKRRGGEKGSRSSVVRVGDCSPIDGESEANEANVPDA